MRIYKQSSFRPSYMLSLVSLLPDISAFHHLFCSDMGAFEFLAVLTLSACTPPLPEVLKLWDFLLAYGAHLNILCVVAQLLLMRDELLAAQRYSSTLVAVSR